MTCVLARGGPVPRRSSRRSSEGATSELQCLLQKARAALTPITVELLALGGRACPGLGPRRGRRGYIPGRGGDRQGRGYGSGRRGRGERGSAAAREQRRGVAGRGEGVEEGGCVEDLRHRARRRHLVVLRRKRNSNSHGARPVHLSITLIKWIRTSRLPITNSLSVEELRHRGRRRHPVVLRTGVPRS